MRLHRFRLHPQKLWLRCHRLFLPRTSHRYWPAFILAGLFFLGAGAIAPSHTQAATTFPVVNAILSKPSTQLACDFVAADEATLAQAILCINRAGPGLHTIQVTADIVLTQPLPQLNNAQASQVVFEGNGHILDADGHGRVLTLFLTQVTLHDWTLRGGRLPLDNTRDNSGGGIQLLGDHGNGTCGLTLIDSTLEDNEASTGGAIANLCDASTITLTHSTIRNNRALRGGGIYVTTAEELFSESVIRNSQIVDNQAQEQGGGILFRAGDAGTNSTIIDSTIAGNTVISGTGGGLSVVTRSEPAITNVTLRNVTISGNQVLHGSGGGLEVSSRGSTNVTLANVTISGNQATTKGGGILIQGAIDIDDTDVRLVNSTVANNVAPTGGGIFKQDGLLTLVNTLVAAHPTGGDCALTVTLGLPNRYVSNGHNLDSDGSCLPANVRQPSDLPNGNANLSALADFGGPTLTHSLRLGSDAIDAGDDAVCAADPINGGDQRGVIRPQGAACDIGAVEMQASQSLTFVVTKFTDSNDGACDTDCSLREAIGAANRTPGRAEIHLASGVYSVTIPTLTDEEGDTIDEDANAIGDLDIADDLVLMGSGAGSTFIAGSGADRLFDILAQAQVTIADLTIQGGRVSEKGGGLSNSGILALHRVHLVDNHAASGYKIGHGGGIFNDGTLTVTHSLIANNRADGGEASYGQGGGIRNDGVLTLIQSTVRDNHVWDDNDYGIGGGILNRGRLRVERSTLSGNGTPGGPGGALANLQGGFVEVINSTLSGNSSGSGGGLANGSPWEDPGTVFLLHTTIANNRGGGLYNRGVTTATNTIIAGNPLDVNESPAALNCVNDGVFVSLGANVLGDGGNCPTTGPGDLTIDNTTVFTTLLQPLADNGGNTLTHALVTASVANDAANDATCADERVGKVDQRGVVRPQGAHCDIGAYEAAAQPVAANLLFVSSRSSATAGGVPFRDEDILAYDFDANTWQMIFDGSDVGISKDVDAFAFLADGSLLLSFNGPTTVPGLGAVDDSDLVQFLPTGLGSDTAGSFAWFLHGADVGLTTDSEDIDAISFTAAGHLVVSTIGDFATPTVSGKDEDLIQLDKASGIWTLFFDGSAVGLANEDVNGLWLDPTTDERYLSVKDSFAFANVQIDADDIFVCAPTPAGGCIYRLFWDSDLHNYGSENIDSFHLGPMPANFATGTQSGALEPVTPATIAEDDDIDDVDVESTDITDHLNSHIFLPLVER